MSRQKGARKARLPWQRPPTSDQKQGARSNRPNSTSALARCDHVAAYASDRLEWVNHFNNKSIDHNGVHPVEQKFPHTCPKDSMKVPLVDAGQNGQSVPTALRMNLKD